MKNEFNPDYRVSPGEILKEELDFRKMSLREFSEKTSISEPVVQSILDGISPVTIEYAMDFERVLGITRQTWLNLEKTYKS